MSRHSHESFPGWSRPAFELAYALVEAGRLEEARALLAAEPSLRAPPWVGPYLRGWITLAEGRAADAIPVLAWASSLAAEGRYYPFPSIPLGRALIATGRLDEAEGELRRALGSPIYQPLEAYHARKLVEEIARLRSASTARAGDRAAAIPGERARPRPVAGRAPYPALRFVETSGARPALRSSASISASIRFTDSGICAWLAIWRISLAEVAVLDEELQHPHHEGALLAASGSRGS